MAFDVSIHADSHDDDHREQQLKEHGTQGSIGTGLLNGYKLVLNYRRHLLTLIPKDSARHAQHSCLGQVIPLVLSVNWGLVSSAHTEGGDALFVWDTGAPGFAMVKANAPAIHVGPRGVQQYGPWLRRNLAAARRGVIQRLFVQRVKILIRAHQRPYPAVLELFGRPSIRKALRLQPDKLAVTSYRRMYVERSRDILPVYPWAYRERPTSCGDLTCQMV